MIVVRKYFTDFLEKRKVYNALMKKISANIWKLNLVAASTEMMFFIPVLIPFLSSLGLSMQEILIVEAVFSVTMVLLEVPSGYFADIFGRKLSVVLGLFFFLCSMMIFTVGTEFWHFVAAEIVGGIGLSFRSGAIEALLYDSLIQLKKEDDYKKYQGNMFLWMRVSCVFAYLTGGAMATYLLKLPVYFAVLPAALGLFATLFLIEPERHEMAAEKWGHFVRIVKESFFGNEKLRWFLFYAAVPWGISFAAFWLFQEYLTEVGFSLFWFGVVIASMNVAGGVAAKYAYKLEDWFGLRSAIGSVPILFFIAWAPLVFIKAKWAVIFMPISSVGWAVSVIFFKDFVQKMVTSDRRATVMSIMSLLERSVFFIYAPIAGWFVDAWGINTAFGMSTVIMLALTSVLWVILLRLKVV